MDLEGQGKQPTYSIFTVVSRREKKVIGKIFGFSTSFQLYTVLGLVYYNSTRKLVLQGADGVVFVKVSLKPLE